MSYEFIVFDPARLPGDKRALVESFQNAGNSFRFPDASECTDELKSYFEELKGYLPWIEDGAEGDRSCDYSFSTSAIACTVSSDPRFAVDTALALCWRLKMGFFDTGNADAYYPAEIWDVIQSRSKAHRPWWKIWRPLGLTIHWSGRVDAAGLARRAFASMRSSQGNTAVVRPLNSVVRRQWISVAKS